MQLCVFSPALADMSLDAALAYLKGLGVEALELGVGGYPGTAHADAKKLVKDAKARQELLDTFEKHQINLVALSVHGNCVHPNPEIAAKFEEDYEAACELCGQLGVDHLVTFSGCPGDGKGDQPNWVTCTWPTEYRKVLDYQWNEVLIPYWQKAAKIAEEGGVKYVALEMHPGFCVYNPDSLLRLRAAVGDIVGANLDPSHLIWQGMDIVSVIRYLGKAIHFFHAKDTEMHPEVAKRTGVLETKPFDKERDRAWLFRTVGHGMSEQKWKQIFGALRMEGYDYALSIEHEDSLMTPREGLESAIGFLQRNMIRQKMEGALWWN